MKYIWYRFFTLILCITSLSLVAGGCTIHRHSPTSSTAQSGSSAVSASSAADYVIHNDDFYELNKDIITTVYEQETGFPKSGQVFNGSCDLNADGKDDAFTLTYNGDAHEAGGKASVLQVGAAGTNLDLVNLIGIYVLKLDKSKKAAEIAVVNLGESDYVSTHFYSYDGTLVTDSGEIHGNIAPDTVHTVYNGSLFTNGKGMLIPALGFIRYLSPNLIIGGYDFSDGKLREHKLDLSDLINKEYTVTFDCEPFFEKIDPIPDDYLPSYDSSKSIHLNAGQKLTVTSIHSFEWCGVTLPDGRNGTLYYFLMS